MLPWCACTSVEWQPVPEDMPTTWRELTLHRAATAYVLASDEDEASDAYLQVDDVVRTVREVGHREPGPGLVIVVSRRDPLLIDDPEILSGQIARWHARATGTRAPANASFGPDFTRAGGRGRAIRERIDASAVIRLAPAGVPLDDTVLSLPSKLVEKVTWIAVMPSPSCVEEVVEELVDLAMEEAELSFFQNLVVAPFMGTARGIAYDAVQKQVLTRLYEVCVAASGGGTEAYRTALLACLKHDGLVPEHADWVKDPQTPIKPLTDEQNVAFSVFEIRDLHLPKTGMVAASATPTADQLRGAPSLGWKLLVDLRPDDQRPDDGLEAAARALGLDYRLVPIDALSDLSRTHAERLDEALRAGEGHFSLVFANSCEVAAALLACRAFWIQGASRRDALALGRHFGLRQMERLVAERLRAP